VRRFSNNAKFSFTIDSPAPVLVYVEVVHTPMPMHAKLPKNYQLVSDVVNESGPGRHLTMSDVFGEAARRRPGIGFTTVYRGLIRLRDLGLVSEILAPGAESATYEPAGPRHAHFRCTMCGRIEDVAYAVSAHVRAQVAAEQHAVIDDTVVTFTGRCKRCLTS
jgi:Fe2+ or Zn2+ uptake regulation protein